MSGNGWKKLHTLIAVHKKYNAHSCAAFPVERWLVQVAFCPIYLIIYHKCVIFGRKQHKKSSLRAKAAALQGKSFEWSQRMSASGRRVKVFLITICAAFTPRPKNPQHHEMLKNFAVYNRKTFWLLTKLRYIIHRQRRSQWFTDLCM